ncbi:MAG: ECF transporter S component [Bacilli bacterium]|nr:ECF transporter S component [Bacilli bacterium]
MKKHFNVSTMAFSAMFAAMSIALNYLKIDLGVIRITLYSLPLLCAGIFCGPLIGSITGLVVGFITQLFSQYGLTPTTPLWMLAPLAWGAISGLFFNIIFKNKRESWLSFIVTIVTTSLLVTLINSLVTFLDGYIFQYPTGLTLISIFIKIGVAMALCIPYTIIIRLVYQRVPNKMKYDTNLDIQDESKTI